MLHENDLAANVLRTYNDKICGTTIISSSFQRICAVWIKIEFYKQYTFKIT